MGDTLIIHIEKADIAYEGVYQALVNEYAKCFVTPGVRYINREEDAGDEGLRRSKESYHPCVCSKNIWFRSRHSRRKGTKVCRKSMNFSKSAARITSPPSTGISRACAPFGTVNLFEGNLYIQTGKVKAVSREMTANPKVELCAFDGETWLRVSAKAVEDDRRAGTAGSARPLSRAAEPLHRRRRQHAGVRAHGGDRDVQCLPGRAARGALVKSEKRNRP